MNSGTCFDLDNGFNCSCTIWWVGSLCQSCPVGFAGNLTVGCHGTVRAFTFHSIGVYFPVPSPHQCNLFVRTDINECAVDNGGCAPGICSNRIGSYSADRSYGRPLCRVSVRRSLEWARLLHFRIRTAHRMYRSLSPTDTPRSRRMTHWMPPPSTLEIRRFDLVRPPIRLPHHSCASPSHFQMHPYRAIKLFCANCRRRSGPPCTSLCTPPPPPSYRPPSVSLHALALPGHVHGRGGAAEYQAVSGLYPYFPFSVIYFVMLRVGLIDDRTVRPVHINLSLDRMDV